MSTANESFPPAPSHAPNDPSADGPLLVSFADIEAAAARLAGVAHRTPTMRSRALDERIGAAVTCKCENFQRVGAFKFRGAYNAISQLTAEQKARGVLTFSSGNHAQAIALAGNMLGVATTIVMPNDAPSIKIAATRSYGGDVVLYDRAEITRESLGAQMAAERGLTIVPPYDHPHVVAGQGTAALECFADAGPFDAILAPCGGGGLLSGTAIAAKTLAPHCRVIGVEPAQADDATRSFHTRILHVIDNPETIADGARTPSLGRVTFPLVCAYVDEMIAIGEAAMVEAMRFYFERMKLVVEPTGALTLAALLTGAYRPAPGSRVAVLISGGNLDPARFASLIAAFPSTSE